MQSGIKIKCKKKLGQFLLTEKPYCIVNDIQTFQLDWNEDFLVPLQPNLPYKITIQFPYPPLNRACGIASFTTQVKEGEIQVYEYHTPFIVTSEGSIKRK